MPQTSVNPAVVVENQLLSRLLVHERNAVQRGSVVIACTPGQVLLGANTARQFIFFPIDVTVAIVRSLQDGKTVHVGLVGNEGIVGFDALMEGKPPSDAAVVQSGGTAYCMPADELRRQFHRGGLLQKYLLRFTNAFLSQLAQNAACSRYHALDARVARLFLMLQDRSGSTIDGTIPSLADTLSSTSDLTEAAIARLASAKSIRRRRDSIEITDSEALHVAACECYETVNEAYQQALAS